MIRRATTAVLAAFLLLAPATSHADLASYTQDFESLVQADPLALGNDAWLVYGNIFDPTHTIYLGGYGPYPAPNGGPAFSAIAAGQGGPSQGVQQLVVYSNYNDGNHQNGNLVEANVFHEQTVGAADVGSTWIFRFDAKMGDLIPSSTALAFIKTLDPGNNYAMTNYLIVDMTTIPTTWGTHSISIQIPPALAGQILQFGFSNTTTGYTPSGVLYDNVSFQRDVPVSAKPSTWGAVKKLYR